MTQEQLQRIAFMANLEATKMWQMTKPWLSMDKVEKQKLAQFVKDSGIVITAIQSTLALSYGRPYGEFQVDVDEMRNKVMSQGDMVEVMKLQNKLDLPFIKKFNDIMDDIIDDVTLKII